MKATLHRAIPPTTIPARLPPLFRTLIDPKKLGIAPVTLAVFPATTTAVVSAGAARRLLVQLSYQFMQTFQKINQYMQFFRYIFV